MTPNSQIRPVSQFNSLRRSFDREKTSRTILLVRSGVSLVALRRSSARQPRAVRPLWRPHQCCRASRRCPPCTASLVRRTRASRTTRLLLFMSPALATGASATVVGVQSSVAPNISGRRPNCAQNPAACPVMLGRAFVAYGHKVLPFHTARILDPERPGATDRAHVCSVYISTVHPRPC